MKNGKKLSWALIILAIVIIAIVIVAVNFSSPKTQTVSGAPTAQINGKEISLQVVATSQDMERGLSGRDSLPANTGMIFRYNNYTAPGFWMKDMKFPIDIIWIKDDIIVGAQENTPVISTGTLPIYYPPSPVNLVLEVNAGFMKDNAVKAGDEVIFKNLK